MTLKILYAGTPEIAVHPLDALVQSPVGSGGWSAHARGRAGRSKAHPYPPRP